MEQARSQRDSEQPTHEGQGDRLAEVQEQNPRAGKSQGSKHGDLTRALADGHGHGVGGNDQDSEDDRAGNTKTRLFGFVRGSLTQPLINAAIHLNAE